MGQKAESVNAVRAHETDADCAPYLVDDVCTVCGVDHSGGCDLCGGRGFHNPGCREYQSEDRR